MVNRNIISIYRKINQESGIRLEEILADEEILAQMDGEKPISENMIKYAMLKKSKYLLYTEEGRLMQANRLEDLSIEEKLMHLNERNLNRCVFCHSEITSERKPEDIVKRTVRCENCSVKRQNNDVKVQGRQKKKRAIS